MSSRRVNSCESERVRGQNGSVGAEQICSGDVSGALTEVLREEIRLPRAPASGEGKDLGGEKSVVHTSSNSPNGSGGGGEIILQRKRRLLDCPITEDQDSVAHLVRHFKPAGCPLSSLRNMPERDAFVKMAVAHAKWRREGSWRRKVGGSYELEQSEWLRGGGRDHPSKKAKVTGTDLRPGVSGDNTVAKPFHWQFSHSKDCPITEDQDSVAHLVRHFKPAGCPLSSLRNMPERDAFVKMAVAHAKGGDPGTGPGKLHSGEPGFLLAGILGTGVPSSGDPEAGVLPGTSLRQDIAPGLLLFGPLILVEDGELWAFDDVLETMEPGALMFPEEELA
ncbi:hypothetical protein F2Q69_00058659 [Brassica cretica]|uniref:Uncharacterized protein n=1 Tax=Brassica cretica TaxID=69181 RepID=A0A8S9RJQ6_BRACR|nr:hypothetical protein F2Q69_00058659 [Brassica cretica]